jgi:hypothetical protein
MKKSVILIAAIVMVAIFANNANAQLTVNNTAGVKILTALSIAQTQGLHFGSIAVKPAQGGTCVVTTGGVRSQTGGVSLSLLGPTFTVATYKVTGEPLYTYAITLPGSITVDDGNSNNMTIDGLLAKSTSGSESNTATGTLVTGTGTEDFAVGGTLNVSAAQAAGVYAGAFDVTVAYN